MQKVLFFVPHLNTIYAGRTIYNGYKNAFSKIGHKFRFLTADDDQEKVYDYFNPNILFVSLNHYFLRFLNLELIKKYKRRGMKVFVNTPFWKSPFTNRINEAASLSESQDYINLIKSCDFGDIYYNIARQGDPRMEGFEKSTGYKHFTLPLAADDSTVFYEPDEKFKADISFIGTNLPGRKKFVNTQVLPLKINYDLKLYGQDWTLKDKILGNFQRLGQFFNVGYLKDLQKPKLKLTEERKIYSSSTISINFHEDYQRIIGGDCNERTFKIPASRGFQIVDNVDCIKDFFVPDKEIIIAKDKNDWFEKIDYFVKNPDKREAIIANGYKRVLSDHTYVNRVNYILSLIN